MKYLKVRWLHDFDSEPILIFSEIDDGGREIRKVEVYRDGRMDYADSASANGSTFLSEGLMPDIHHIAAQDEFDPAEIGPDEFERHWRRAHT